MESFRQATDWLESLASEAQFFSANKAPSLDNMKSMLSCLGHPEKKAEYRVIIGGTAGKGTVCNLIEDVLLREGKSVLKLSSPHILDVRERIVINGCMVEEALFGEAIMKVKSVSKSNELSLTYYEAIVLAGMYLAGQQEVEVLLAEVGIGGEWDGVNAMAGDRIAGLTFIGEDHLELLGPELEDVAWTKAGIFTKETVAAFSTEKIYRWVLDDVSPVQVKHIKGITHKLNKKIAREILEFVLGHSDFQMRKSSLAARWEKLSYKGKTIILDGAHSKPRFEYRLPQIKKLASPKVAVIGLLDNHDKSHLSILAEAFDEVIWTHVPGTRSSHDPAALQQLYGGLAEGVPEKALEKALMKSDTVCVMGSFYLCGYFKSILNNG